MSTVYFFIADALLPVGRKRIWVDTNPTAVETTLDLRNTLAIARRESDETHERSGGGDIRHGNPVSHRAHQPERDRGLRPRRAAEVCPSLLGEGSCAVTHSASSTEREGSFVPLIDTKETTMRNPYETPNEWEAGGEPEECEPEPLPECRGCQSKEGPFHYFGGWPWCRETCYREIVALYLKQPQPTEEELLTERMNQVRR